MNKSASSGLNLPVNATNNDYAMNNHVQCTGLQHFWNSNEVAFKDWLHHRDISKPTKNTYYNALVEFFKDNDVHKPKDFRKLQLKDKESRGLRNLFNYCEDEDIDILAGHPLEKWRRFVKIPKSGVTEVYITDEEVQEGYVSCPTEVKILYKLLVCSGNRLIHLYRMLQLFNEKKVVIDGDIAHYPSSEFSSGNKRTFQVFFPTAYISEIKSFQSPDKYKTVSKKLQVGRVSAKTIRKWHLNVMIKEGVTESLADFIQGRAPATVGSAHYLNKVQQAKEEYKRIIEKLAL
ncbi:hypothetical protein CUN85_12850 [Methanolobus halotolerans]|uniref:Integrase SSV1 C-terminal domain-containing protein n=1 Tax=Methanolobus halotolerans TaxID=2052935 RepID=A0A4E0Q235_9EURY|nr:hypothetical protein CUN85_12850 [Methanolobus halotolerans]